MLPFRRQARPRLLVHVGRHKTGTTSLQQCLAAASLRPLGILYPQAGRQGDQHAAFAAALLSQPQDDPAGLVAADGRPQAGLHQLLEALEQEVRAERPRLIVLSSEVFCELAKRRPRLCQFLLEQLSSRWELELLQLVRPLPTFFLSAFRHQLREGTFLRRSPFSWYGHCRHKARILDGFWPYTGVPLRTLLYQAQDSTCSVLDVIAHAAALSPRRRRRLLALRPAERANRGHHNRGLLLLYVLYLVRARAELRPGGLAPEPGAILSLAAFEAALEAEDPALLQQLGERRDAEQELLQLCQARDQQLLAAGGAEPVGQLPGDSPEERLHDWQFLVRAAVDPALMVALDRLWSSLPQPAPAG